MPCPSKRAKSGHIEFAITSTGGDHDGSRCHRALAFEMQSIRTCHRSRCRSPRAQSQDAHRISAPELARALPAPDPRCRSEIPDSFRSWSSCQPALPAPALPAPPCAILLTPHTPQQPGPMAPHRSPQHQRPRRVEVARSAPACRPTPIVLGLRSTSLPCAIMHRQIGRRNLVAREKCLGIAAAIGVLEQPMRITVARQKPFQPQRVGDRELDRSM